MVLTAQRERGATKAAAVVARRTLTGARAAELVRLANRLPRDNLGPHSCPAETGLYLIRALFVAPERTLTFTVDPICGSVEVKPGSEPAVVDTPSFRRALTDDLGLPFRWP